MQPPKGMAEFEVAVMADGAPAVCLVDRELMRGLFIYLRDLEYRVREAEDGEF